MRRALLTTATILSMLIPTIAAASSHREAPGIAQDPTADNTDVYAFISPNNPDNVVIVANFNPLLIPASGPNFHGFSEDVRYEICIDNDGDAVEDRCYRWRFDSYIENPGTFLYNTNTVENVFDADLNVYQIGRVRQIDYRPDGRERARRWITRDVPVAPWHVGSRSMANYASIADSAIQTDVGAGLSLFAGPRDEPFFVDLHVFDLLGVGGAPTTDGLNVMSIVMEIPITELADGGERPSAGTVDGTGVIGIHARTLRRRLTIRDGHHVGQNGAWQQISRLGWPLVNEVIIPLGDKDFFNSSRPVDDVTNFGAHIVDLEVQGLLRAVLGLPCDDSGEPRFDVVDLLALGDTLPADLLRLNIESGQTFADSGFPNGRTLEDDVVDTLLTVACNGGIPVGDGVDGNDLPFLSEFPYLAHPHSGNPAP